MRKNKTKNFKINCIPSTALNSGFVHKKNRNEKEPIFFCKIEINS